MGKFEIRGECLYARKANDLETYYSHMCFVDLYYCEFCSVSNCKPPNDGVQKR